MLKKVVYFIYVGVGGCVDGEAYSGSMDAHLWMYTVTIVFPKHDFILYTPNLVTQFMIV